MLNIMKRSFLTGVGLMAITAEKAETLALELIKQGELKTEESKAFVDNIMVQAEKERQEFSAMVAKEVREVLSSMGLVTKEDLKVAQARILELEERLSEIEKDVE